MCCEACRVIAQHGSTTIIVFHAPTYCPNGFRCEAKLLANSLKRSSFCTSLRYGAFTFRGSLTHSYARFPRVSEIHSDKCRAFSPMELPEQLQVSCGRPESASSISWG